MYIHRKEKNREREREKKRREGERESRKAGKIVSHLIPFVNSPHGHLILSSSFFYPSSSCSRITIIL